MRADVGEHPLAQRERVHVDVEELRAELADDRQVDPVLDLGEWIAVRTCDRTSSGRESLVKLHHDLQAKRRCAAGRWCSPVPRRAPLDVAVRKLLERRAASDRSSGITIGVPSLTEMGIWRSLGMNTCGGRPMIAIDVLVRDPDSRVGTVQDQRDAVGVVAHQLERLEPELRVLERQRVEHADDADVGREVDRGNHLRREARGRVDDHVVAHRPKRREDVSQKVDGHRACLVRPRRRHAGR